VPIEKCQYELINFRISLITLLTSIGVPCSISPVGWYPALRSLQGSLPLNPPSMLELEASLGLLSLRRHLNAPVPLPSPSFKEGILPSPLSSSPTLVSALTLTSPSLRSSPSPPTHCYLPPHCCQDRGGVRADLGGHLKYSRRWSGVRAGVLLGAQGAVRRGENRGGL